MKKQYISYLVIFVSTLICPSLKAVAEDNQPIGQQEADPGIIIFFLLIFVLAFLALWLLRSSKKLRMMNHVEPDGATWIHQHLSDLESQQLGKLIKRSQPRANKEANNSNINKTNA
jgi:hypothetical protein